MITKYFMCRIQCMQELRKLHNRLVLVIYVLCRLQEITYRCNGIHRVFTTNIAQLITKTSYFGFIKIKDRSLATILRELGSSISLRFCSRNDGRGRIFDVLLSLTGTRCIINELSIHSFLPLNRLLK